MRLALIAVEILFALWNSLDCARDDMAKRLQRKAGIASDKKPEVVQK